MIYDLDTIKNNVNKVINKELKIKDISFNSNSEIKIFRELLRLKKLQIAKKINRYILRTQLNDFIYNLELRFNNIDKLAFTKNVAMKVNKREGEINSRIVQSKDKRIKLWS